MCVVCNAGLAEFLKASSSRRDFLKYAGATAASSGLMASGIPPTPVRAQSATPTGTADVIFRGGPILTMNEGVPRAEALATRGAQILAVGPAADVEARRGPSTRFVDLGGRALLPGLIDPHMHFVFVLFEDWIDVSAIATPTYEGVQTKLREGARAAKAGDWVRAWQFDPSITQGAHTPTLAELDALAPDNPFFMLENNGHVAYVNSRALQTTGITRDTPDPPTARFVRGPDGALTGKLEETLAYLPFIANADPLGDGNARAHTPDVRSCCRGAMHGAARLRHRRVARNDRPGIAGRRHTGKPVDPLSRNVGLNPMSDWEKMDIRPGRGDDRFRVDGIKAWSDGSNQAYTGYQRTNYLGRDSRGALNYTLEQLTEAVRRAHRAGWQVGVHANGDAGIDTTIAAYETVLRETPRTDHRHRIEHCSILHPEQIAKMRELGLSPSFLIGHVRWWGKAFRDRILGPERASLYDLCASAQKAGLRISLHSDWNVTPIEPLRCVEDAVSRIMNEGGEVLNSDERITAETALRAVTIDAAWQCKMDNITGSLEPGKYADLALLERDPTTVSPTEISKIKVSETWLSGERRYVA